MDYGLVTIHDDKFSQVRLLVGFGFLGFIFIFQSLKGKNPKQTFTSIVNPIKSQVSQPVLKALFWVVFAVVLLWVIIGAGWITIKIQELL